jgi:hypothetical protein
VAVAGVAAAACGHPDKKIVDQYFNAVNQQDTQTLQSFAAVNFDKKVDHWDVKQTLGEETAPAPLPDLLAKAKAADKAIAENKKNAAGFQMDHFSDVEVVREADKKGSPAPARVAAVAQQWHAFGQKDRDLRKALADAKDAADKERRNVVRSVGDLPDVDTLTGDMTTRRLLVNLTVGGQPQDYVMTLRRYSLKNAQGGQVNSRWVVQSLAPGNS